MQFTINAWADTLWVVPVLALLVLSVVWRFIRSLL